MSEEIQTILQHVVNGVSLGAIYALIALGYTMVYGILQLINFAHSDVFMVGAYLGYFAALWTNAGSIPRPALIFVGIPLGLFLAVLNHGAISRLLKRPPASLPERKLLSSSVLVAVAAAIAAGWWGGYFTLQGMPATIFGLPTVTFFKAVWSVILIAAPVVLIMRGLLLPLLVGAAVTAVALFGIDRLFPVVGSISKSIAFGALHTDVDGEVTGSRIVFKVQHIVVIDTHPRVVPMGDEPIVKKDEVLQAGQVYTKQGATIDIGGKVHRIDKERSKVTEITIGDKAFEIPESHKSLVKKGDKVVAGQKITSGIVIGFPIFCLLFSMVGCAVLGFLIERTAYRPLRHAPRINSLITAIGVSLLLVNSAQLIFGASPEAFPEIVPAVKPFELGGVRIDMKQITILGTAVVLMLILQYIVYHTRLGLGMRAVSYNHEWAGLMGVPVDRIVSATFMIGSSLAAAGGVLVGVYYHKVDPMMGMLLGLKAFVAAVLGGIGNLPGALIGGLIMGLSEEFVAVWSSSFRDAIAFLILIFILLYKPSGLLGKTQVEKV